MVEATLYAVLAVCALGWCAALYRPVADLLRGDDRDE